MKSSRFSKRKQDNINRIEKKKRLKETKRLIMQSKKELGNDFTIVDLEEKFNELIGKKNG